MEEKKKNLSQQKILDRLLSNYGRAQILTPVEIIGLFIFAGSYLDRNDISDDMLFVKIDELVNVKRLKKEEN